MYIYKKPKGKRVSITRKQHNKFLPTRRLSLINSLFFRYDYYVDESGITSEQLIRLSGKLLNTMLIPIYILKAGLPETYDEIKKMWFQKKYGSFLKEYIGTYSSKYDQFLKMVNKDVD